MARLAVLALGALLTGCVTGGRPTDLSCAEPTIRFSAKLAHDSLEPSALAACRGQQVSLTVSVAQEGVLHIHGYGAESKELSSGETVTFDFPADHSGQFVVELHNTAHPSGLSLGILTVYEP